MWTYANIIEAELVAKTLVDLANCVPCHCPTADIRLIGHKDEEEALFMKAAAGVGNAWPYGEVIHSGWGIGTSADQPHLVEHTVSVEEHRGTPPPLATRHLISSPVRHWLRTL